MRGGVSLKGLWRHLRRRRRSRTAPYENSGELTGLVEEPDAMPARHAATPAQLPGSIEEPTPEPDDPLRSYEVVEPGPRISKQNAITLMRGMNLRRSVKWSQEAVQWAKDYLEFLIKKYGTNPTSDEQRAEIDTAREDVMAAENDLAIAENEFTNFMRRVED